MVVVMTTRFNSKTYSEWCRQQSLVFRSYFSPTRIRKSEYGDVIIILEMHNDLNLVTGIGIVHNIPIHDRIKVFSHGWYNRVRYKAIKRVNRLTLLNKTMKLKTGEVVRVIPYLDEKCFFGPTHCKRNSGISMLPECFHVDAWDLYRLLIA